MPTRLRLDLLAGFKVGFAGGQPCALPTRKSQALVAYLAHPAGRFHSRDTLAALLWGDTPEAHARQSLRQALGGIRRALHAADGAIVLTQGDAVALARDAITVDVDEFQAAVGEGSLEALERAAALYKGEFLAGLRVDEPPFEAWCVGQRERLHETALAALARLLREYGRGGRADAAIQTALRVLSIDPLHEAAHRALMRLLVGVGRRAAALQQYQTCVTALRQELGTDPEEETKELYRELLRSSRPSFQAAPASAQSGRYPQGLRPVDTPMIGRDSELSRLRRAIPRAIDDGGRVVLITGEAGIGKTRMIQELLTSEIVAHVRIALGRCHETERTLPLRPWIEALRTDGTSLPPSVHDRLAPSTRARLIPLFPELAASADRAIPPEAQPALLFDPLLEVLVALAAQQPLLVVLENLQWADTMSAQLLAFLGRRIDRLPVLILGSVRSDELFDAPTLSQALKELRQDDRLDEIALGPLSVAQSHALVRALRPSIRGDVDQIASEISALSEGNPFVIVESTRSMEPLTVAGPRVGRGVRELVTARLERLPELARSCVAVAAAIGREFSFALLTRAATLTEHDAAAAVETLVRHRILDSVGDRLDFCHDWIRHVAYENVLPARRLLIHAAIGDALEELHRDRLDDVADQLGTHYTKAGNVRKALPHLIRFSDLAALRYALEDAAQVLAQAMAWVDELPASEQDRTRLDVALRQAFVLSMLGRQQDIPDLLRRHAGAAKRVGDHALVAEYYFRLGLTCLFLGDRVQAGLAAGQALEHGERAGDDERVGKALHVLSLQAYEMGHPDAGITHATRAIQLLDHPHRRPWLGLAYHDLALNRLLAGDLDAALAAVRHEEAIGRSESIPRLVALAGYVTAWVHGLRGDIDVAIETARRALQVARDPMVNALISGTLGIIHLEAGDAAAAQSLLEQVIEQVRRSPLRVVEIRITAALAEAHLVAGDPARGRETARRALDLACTDGMPLNIGLAQRALGRIAAAAGHLLEAERCLVEALTTFTSCGARFEAARTHVALAELRAGRADIDVARGDLATAIVGFERANAPRRVATAHELARSHGISLIDA